MHDKIGQRSIRNSRKSRAVQYSISGTIVAAFLLVLPACSSSGQGAGAGPHATNGAANQGATGTAQSSSDKSGSFVVAWNSPPDVTYLPLLMAIHDVQQQGYDLKTETVSGANTATEALASNRAQFTSNQITAEAAAAAKGAPIKIVLATASNPTDWVTASGYEDCNKLTGKPVGIFGPAASSSYTQLMNYYFEKFCPNVKPKLVTIPDSGLRAQALANGQIVATVLASSDATNLVTKLDTKHHYNVVNLAQTFPGLGDTYLYANTNVTQSAPGVVQALVTADLKSVRQIYANPSTVAALIKQYYTDSASMPSLASAQQAVKDKVWHANGGLDSKGIDGLSASLKVFSLPGKASSLVNSTFVNGALKALGSSSDTPN